MTKRELEYAQFLKRVYESAQEFADEIDPKRRRVQGLAQVFDGLGGTAWGAFFRLTLRHPGDVAMHELNTESPAEWTQREGGEGAT